MTATSDVLGSFDRVRDALLVVDLQPDFMPGGPPAVAGGDQIAAPIYVQAAEQPGMPLVESERRAFAEFDRVYGALARAQRTAKIERDALPVDVRRLDEPAAWPMVASDALVDLIAARVREAA